MKKRLVVLLFYLFCLIPLLYCTDKGTKTGIPELRCPTELGCCKRIDWNTCDCTKCSESLKDVCEGYPPDCCYATYDRNGGKICICPFNEGSYSVNGEIKEFPGLGEVIELPPSDDPEIMQKCNLCMHFGLTENTGFEDDLGCRVEKEDVVDYIAGTDVYSIFCSCDKKNENYNSLFNFVCGENALPCCELRFDQATGMYNCDCDIPCDEAFHEYCRPETFKEYEACMKLGWNAEYWLGWYCNLDECNDTPCEGVGADDCYADDRLKKGVACNCRYSTTYKTTCDRFEKYDAEIWDKKKQKIMCYSIENGKYIDPDNPGDIEEPAEVIEDPSIGYDCSVPLVHSNNYKRISWDDRGPGYNDEPNGWLITDNVSYSRQTNDKGPFCLFTSFANYINILTEVT